MPVIDLTLSLGTINLNTQLTNYLWIKFGANFSSDSTCTFYLLTVMDLGDSEGSMEPPQLASVVIESYGSLAFNKLFRLFEFT